MFTFTFSLVEILFFLFMVHVLKFLDMKVYRCESPTGAFFLFFIVLFVLIVVGMINLSREL